MALFLKICFVLIVIHLVYAIAIVAWHIWIGTSIALAAIPFERVLPGATQRILVSGDSTSVGTGSATPEGSVAGRFGAAYSNAEVINRSKNGRKIHATLPVLDEFAGQHFDLIVLQIGANDILRFTPLPQVEKDLVVTLEKARSLSSNVIVLHSGNIGAAPFFPRPWDLLWTKRARQVREIYLRVVPAHGAHYVDLFQERRDDKWLQDPKKFYAADGLHLSSAGYEDWFNKIQAVMQDAKISL